MSYFYVPMLLPMLFPAFGVCVAHCMYGQPAIEDVIDH